MSLAAPTAAEPPIATSLFGIYFEPESVPEDQRLNADVSAFDGLNFQVVRTVDDFIRALDREQPGSIWIHRAALDFAPADRLTGLKRESVIIVGVETTKVELAELIAPVPNPAGDWRHPTQAISAIYWEHTWNAATPTSGQGTGGSGWSWTVMAFDLEDPGPLVYLVQQAIETRDQRRSLGS